MDTWDIYFEDNQHFLDADGDKWGKIVDIKPGTLGIVQIIGENEKRKNVYLKDFNVEGSAYSEKFRATLLSRTAFLQAWTTIKDKTIVVESSDTHPAQNLPLRNLHSIDTSEFNSDQNENREKESIPSNRSKVIGECLSVHISNMVSPDDERLLRAIDEDHVDQIKEYLTHRKDCFTILIGNLTSFESVEEIDKDDLTQPNKFKIETLGGNHTRKAIQELLEADEDRYRHYSIIQCKLFANLPTIDALMLGFDHNLSNEYGKQTSAEDLLKLCRKELKNICQDHNTTIDNCPAKISKLWHKKLCHIFGLNTTPRDLHNRYKIILSLAKSREDVWIQLRTLFARFNARELKYQPSGILKQGHLKQLSSYTEQERFNTLKTVVEKKDWRLMKGGNNSATGKKLPDVPQNKAGIHLNEENKKLQNEKKLLAVELKEIKSQLAVNQKQAKLLSAKNVQLREIIKEKDGKIAVLEKQCEDQNEDLAFYMFSEQNKKREITEDNVVPSAICDSNSPKNLQEHSTKDNLAVDILETNKDDPQPPSTTTSKHSSLESQETDKNGDDLKHVKQADRVKELNNSHICDLCDKKFVDDTFLAKHINQYHRILETNKETDRKRYWECVEIDSDKAPAKAFHAVDGPRIKKNKFNFSP